MPRQTAPIGPVAERDVFTLMGGGKRAADHLSPMDKESVVKEPAALIAEASTPLAKAATCVPGVQCGAGSTPTTCCEGGLPCPGVGKLPLAESTDSSCPRQTAPSTELDAIDTSLVEPMAIDVAHISDEIPVAATQHEPAAQSEAREFDVADMLSGGAFLSPVSRPADSGSSTTGSSVTGSSVTGPSVTGPSETGPTDKGPGAAAESITPEPELSVPGTATPAASVSAPPAKHTEASPGSTANQTAQAPLAAVEYQPSVQVVQRSSDGAATAEFTQPGPASDDVFLLVTGGDQQQTTEPNAGDRVALKQVERPSAPRSSGDGSIAEEKSSGRAAPVLRSIYETTVDLAPRPQTIDGKKVEPQLPPDVAIKQFGDYANAAVGGNEWVRFAVQDYLWASPAMRHKPLYFEQPNLERYGNHVGGTCLASAAATGHFVGSLLTLPYKVGAQPPRECVYTLGVYRPGSCNPHFFHVSPISGKGLLTQAAAVTGIVYLFP